MKKAPAALNKEECPKGQTPLGACRKQLFESGNKRRLFKNALKYPSLKKSKLTPVKLFLASPFLRKKVGVASSGSSSLTQNQEDENKENSFELRLNLESLKEAQNYDLPFVPFPYQATPIATPQILSAVTEGPNYRYLFLYFLYNGLKGGKIVFQK